MASLNLITGAVAFASAFAAGTINSVAGGGTLITFPTLVWLGLDSITANATSTVAIWPFSVGGTLGYRKEVMTIPQRMWVLAAPGIAGGLLGAILLRMTPASTFDVIVPYLILFATLLFMAQDPIQRWLKSSESETHKSPAWLIGMLIFQFLVGIYGGYFGAGIGIMMLAAMSILGLTDIHQMNGLKAVLAGAINAVAAIYFMVNHMVFWPDVGIMAIGAIMGGFMGAGIARRMGRTAVRRTVVFVGFAMAISLFVKK
jgi:uncharacterized membrane protein YfcA